MVRSTCLALHSFSHSMPVRYPVLIDAVIQSGGVGFIGTDRSTMSEIAMRRCQSWHDGVTRIVKWGYIGADDD